MNLLEVKGLTKRFGGVTAVDNLSFNIRSGELLSIIGPNGAGKTSLFNLMTGFYKPGAGKIILNNTDITGFNPYKITRAGIARTFQMTSIYEKSTVIENLIIAQALHSRSGLFGSIIGTPSAGSEKRKMMEKAEEIMIFTGLQDRRDKLSGSLTEESQKKLSIGLALATGPKLLLLDEPTGGINLHEIGGLINLVNRIRNSGITVCLIEHKMKMVMNISDRIIVLSYGKHLAEGTPEEIAANEEVIKAYLGGRRAS